MNTPTLTEITEAVSAAVHKNGGTPIAIIPLHDGPEIRTGTAVWRRDNDQRPITHTYIFNKNDKTAFLEHGDYHHAKHLSDFESTRHGAIRAFPDLPRRENPIPAPADPRQMPPHVLATQLMAGDPSTFKQGYTKENAILATVDFHKLTDEEADDLRHDMSDAVLSLYKIDRRFGGSEEGGWWYDHYDHIATLTKPTLFWKLGALLAELDERDTRRFNTNGKPDARLLIEMTPRALQTTEIPRYQ